MPSDPIVEEIHAIREALSRVSGDDIRKIAEAAKARQAQSGKLAVRLPPRKARSPRKASVIHGSVAQQGAAPGRCWMRSFETTASTLPARVMGVSLSGRSQTPS